MEGASTTHKEEDDGQAPRLLDAPVKIQDQEGNDREGLDFMWGTDKVRERQSTYTMPLHLAPCSDLEVVASPVQHALAGGT